MQPPGIPFHLTGHPFPFDRASLSRSTGHPFLAPSISRRRNLSNIKFTNAQNRGLKKSEKCGTLQIESLQDAGKERQTMKEINQKILTGERALFAGQDLRIVNTIFEDGESPLKESRNIELRGSMFKWKYPLWYAKDIDVRDCTWFEMARAGVWYSDRVSVRDCAIEAPKNFRRCRDLTLQNVSFANAAETLWHCDGVRMENVTARGDYFAMNSRDITVSGLTLYGNYSFDGAENVEIRSSRLLSKDAFWNSRNVTVYDSFLSGEYLGWNAKNLTLVNCTVESLQGLCYVENLVMENCRLLNTTLAFEYSTVEADLRGRVDSVKNPSGGTITADEIGELILEEDRIDPKKTCIRCRPGRTEEKPDEV